MPHQCVRCGKIYDDGSKEIMSSCSCGARMFFFIRKENLEKLKKEVERLNQKQKEAMIKDVYDLIGEDENKDPIVLDIESINIPKPGKYEIDLVSLFKKAPLIYKLEEGKYIIDLAESFKTIKKK
jgi:uncharacterized protein